ncbi:MAG: S8 family serine peptidase, partial [Patescibacteria group bacterium]
DLSGIQAALARLFGVEIEPVLQLHISPVSVEESIEPKGRGKTLRPLPSDQTPWGIQVIYNDSSITASSGGLGVNVAVLDTGVLKTHNDLKNRIKQCKDFTQSKTPLKDGVCGDLNGHGTHVSGIILADAGADKLGIYGIAPEANLLSYKVCGSDGGCWADDVAFALRVAADNSADIINLSLGSDTESQLIREAVNYAVSKDVLVVAAAGNDGPYPLSIDYPAAQAEVMAVGAVDISVSVPDWSSRGGNFNTLPYSIQEKDMEFGAPGVGVESAWKNGGYAVLSGTSMSSPHAAGLAAKLWPAPEKVLEGFRAQATRDLLHQLAKDIWTLGDDDATGFGLPQVK